MKRALFLDGWGYDFGSGVFIAKLYTLGQIGVKTAKPSTDPLNTVVLTLMHKGGMSHIRHLKNRIATVVIYSEGRDLDIIKGNTVNQIRYAA